jgi:hypothetical protein
LFQVPWQHQHFWNCLPFKIIFDILIFMWI